MKKLENTFFECLHNISGLDQNECAKLLELTLWHELGRKEFLLKEGDFSNRFFLVLRGDCRAFYLNEKGHEFTKSFYSRGDIFFCSDSILKKLPCSFYLEALEVNTLVASIDHDEFFKLAKKTPAFYSLILSFLRHYVLKQDQRERDFLLLNAKGRYENFRMLNDELFQKIPQYLIASYLGVSHISLCRLLKKNEAPYKS